MNFHLTKALIFIVGFVVSYLSAESECPSSGNYTRTYSLPNSNCNSLSTTITSNNTTVTWDNGISTYINNVTFNYNNGRLIGRGNGEVILGTFTGFDVITLFAHFTPNATQKCANEGITELPGVATIIFYDDSGFFACIGRAKIVYDPPLTDTSAVVQRTNTVEYDHCIGSMQLQC